MRRLGIVCLEHNNLTEVDIKHNSNLVFVELTENNLMKLDISENIKMADVNVDDNVKVQLSKVDPNLQINGSFITKIQPNSAVADLQRSILSNNENYEHRLIQINVMAIMNNLNPSTLIKTGYGYQVVYMENENKNLMKTIH